VLLHDVLLAKMLVVWTLHRRVGSWDRTCTQDVFLVAHVSPRALSAQARLGSQAVPVAA
jgi:hypothetical protein